MRVQVRGPPSLRKYLRRLVLCVGCAYRHFKRRDQFVAIYFGRRFAQLRHQQIHEALKELALCVTRTSDATILYMWYHDLCFQEYKRAPGPAAGSA